MSVSPEEKEPTSSERKDALDLYWKMYNEHATQARHHETLRGTISTIMLTLSGAMLTYFATNHGQLGFGSQNKDVGLALIVTGLLGALLSFTL